MLFVQMLLVQSRGMGKSEKSEVSFSTAASPALLGAVSAGCRPLTSNTSIARCLCWPGLAALDKEVSFSTRQNNLSGVGACPPLRFIFSYLEIKII